MDNNDEFMKYRGEMIRQEERLKSFADWPYPDTANCSRHKMGENGFYYIGTVEEKNLAMCYVCFKAMYWDEDDDPKLEHASHSPDCPFVKLNKVETDLTVGEFIDLFTSSGCTYKKKYMEFIKEKLLRRKQKYVDLLKNM